MAWASQEAERQGSSTAHTGKHKQHTCITLQVKNAKLNQTLIQIKANKQRHDFSHKEECLQVFTNAEI